MDYILRTDTVAIAHGEGVDWEALETRNHGYVYTEIPGTADILAFYGIDIFTSVLHIAVHCRPISELPSGASPRSVNPREIKKAAFDRPTKDRLSHQNPNRPNIGPFDDVKIERLLPRQRKPLVA